MRDHWRTPVRRICENCKQEFSFTSGRKKRKYCNLQCSADALKKHRQLMNIMPREIERRMWARYWYHRFHGIKGSEQVLDPVESVNFAYCHRELLQTKYKPI